VVQDDPFKLVDEVGVAAEDEQLVEVSYLDNSVDVTDSTNCIEPEVLSVGSGKLSQFGGESNALSQIGVSYRLWQ
jgi:hypothetical protein